MVLTSFPCFGKNGGRRGSTSGASWNIRTGISEEKREQVLLELGRRGISFCALQEVKLKGCGSIEQTVVDEVKQGSHVEVEAQAMKKHTKNKTFTYTLFYSGTEKGGQHGVGIAIEQQFMQYFKERGQNEKFPERIMWVVMEGCTIISFYGFTETKKGDQEVLERHRANKEALYAELVKDYHKLLVNANKNKQPIFILGDFNARIGRQSDGGMIGSYGNFHEDHPNENGELLLEFAAKHHLYFPRTFFKHPNRETSTWRGPKRETKDKERRRGPKAALDHALVHCRWKKSFKNCKAMPLLHQISDHKGILFKFQLKFPSIKEIRQRRHKICTDFIYDVEKMQNVSREVHQDIAPFFHDDGSIKDVDMLWKTLCTSLETASHRQKVVREHEHNQISTAKTQKLWLKNTYKAVMEAKKSVRQDKDLRWKKFGERLNAIALKTHPREFYQTLKKFIGCRSRKVDTNAQEYANKLQAKCSTDFDGIKMDIVPLSKPIIPPTQEDILQIAKTMKNYKAPGDDGIPAEVWKQPEFCRILHAIITNIITTGKIPDAWRKALVIPIPKPKKGEFRPITLLCTAYKIYTKWIYKSIQQNIVQAAGPSQAGFIPKRSTFDQINYIRRLREKAIEFNTELWIVLADVKSAFDTVNRNSLYTLLSNNGVSLEMINLIQDSMNDMETTVHTRYEQSDPVRFNAGVPQGGPASGPLFTIPIAHAVSSLSTPHKEFADDLAMPLKSKEEIAPTLQTIVDELKSVGMKLAPNKYEVYHIGKDGKEKIYDVTNDNFQDRNWHKTLRVNKDKKSIRYLGDQIGPSSCSIKKRIILAEKAYAILRTKLWAQPEVQVKTKVLVFKAIVMSTLLYGLKCHSISEAKMRSLNGFCLRKLKSLFGHEHDARTSYEEMDKLLSKEEIKWRWPEEIISEQRLKFFLSQIQNPEIQSILIPEEGLKRKRGRPRRRMIDAINEDVERFYDVDIRTFDLRPHKMQSAKMARKVLYFCSLHHFEILEKINERS